MLLAGIVATMAIRSLTAAWTTRHQTLTLVEASMAILWQTKLGKYTPPPLAEYIAPPDSVGAPEGIPPPGPCQMSVN